MLCHSCSKRAKCSLPAKSNLFAEEFVLHGSHFVGHLGELLHQALVLLLQLRHPGLQALRLPLQGVLQGTVCFLHLCKWGDKRETMLHTNGNVTHKWGDKRETMVRTNGNVTHKWDDK